MEAAHRGTGRLPGGDGGARTNGHRYRNDLGSWNVWAVDVVQARWTDLDAGIPVGPQPWKQPVGSTDAYQIGAQVTYGGKTWTSTAANNVWQPRVYGWS